MTGTTAAVWATPADPIAALLKALPDSADAKEMGALIGKVNAPRVALKHLSKLHP